MKKAVFISYNQALTERVAFILDQLQIRGFTQWPLVNGAGTVDGEPRMGTHTWPEMNSATLTIVEEEMVPLILKYVKNLDEVNKENGTGICPGILPICIKKRAFRLFFLYMYFTQRG